MINRNFSFMNVSLKASLRKEDLLLASGLLGIHTVRCFTHNRTFKGKHSSPQSMMYLHTGSSLRQARNKCMHPIVHNSKFSFSVQSSKDAAQQKSIDYNSMQVLSQLYRNSSPLNKFAPSVKGLKNMSQIYPTISFDLERKYELLQQILHSQERNMYKIVQEMVVVLQSFVQINRREILEENVVKVIKQFNNKLISAYLQNVQTLQEEQIQARKQRGTNLNTEQQNDSTYQLHQKYNKSGVEPQNDQKDQFLDVYSVRSSILDINFIFFYVETLKDWLFNRIQTDEIIKHAQQEMYQFLTAREVSDIQDVLKNAINNLKHHYIHEKQPLKRDKFPFDKKIRSLCLIPYFQDLTSVQKYLDRLAEQNLAIFLKEAQIINAMYDIAEVKPQLNNTSFVYQIQSTKVYQNFFNLNSSYIKSRFIIYVRKFMVCYQQIQFYQLFREIGVKMKYPTIRSFIRLAQILKTEADDLHCEYNKTMNKYNYNILVSIITTHTYNVQNTKLTQFLQLYESLNSLQKSGQILYEEISKYLKVYVSRENHKFDHDQIERLYKLFNHVIDQAKPVFKYEEKEGLNKEYGRRSTILINILFDILLENYPQMAVISSKYIKCYLKPDDLPYFSSSLSNDEKMFNLQIEDSNKMQQKMKKIADSFNKLLDSHKFSILNKNQNQLFSTLDFLQTISLYLKINVHIVKENEDTQNQHNENSDKKSNSDSYKLLNKILSGNSEPLELTLFKKVFQPLLAEYQTILGSNAKLSSKQIKHMYRNVYQIMECINQLQNTQIVSKEIKKYLQIIERQIFDAMKCRLAQQQKAQQRKRTQGIMVLQMSIPQGDNEMILCLGQILKFSTKVDSIVNINSEKQLSAGSNEHVSSLKLFYENLPLLFNFINKLGILGFKAIQESDLINVLQLMRKIQSLRSVHNPVLLIQLNTAVYENLYCSLSVFVAFLSDRGKYYFKMTHLNADSFLQIIDHFISKKKDFKGLVSKKKLVVVQAILVILIKKKYLKLNNTHLKRSEHAHVLLQFLQIFQYPENLTIDLRKVVSQVEFTSGDLQDFPVELLQRFTDINWVIGRYLQDNKVSLSNLKKLNKLTVQELRKQFQSGRSSKIYEMIIKNCKYILPFQLPEPKTDDQNAKLLYIIEKIYNKINSKTDYTIPCRKTSKSVKSKRQKEGESGDLFGNFMQNQQKTGQNEQSEISQNNLQQGNLQSFSKKSSNRTQYINLDEYKDYIKREALVNHTYEDHYKMNENKLPIYYKKQTWKNLGSIPKDLEISSLEIDEKIDENIYKRLLLSVLGYVQKVKILAKEFHSHSFIQYVGAQLDMQVFIHGCVARISRKNRPEQNFLFVSALDNNYKLLYICTHILRQSGENAFILPQKTRESEFKQFLQKVLPQPFQSDESEIVDKVVKGRLDVVDEQAQAVKIQE